jgi:hypothetical protein
MTRNTNAYDIISPEPKLTGPLTKLQLIGVLNWFSQNRTDKDSEKYIQSYFKKNFKLELTTDSYKDQTTTFGFVCRIIMNGGEIPEENQKWFDSCVAEIKERHHMKKTIQKTISNKKDRSDIFFEKVSEIIGDLEFAFDEYIEDFKDYSQIKMVFHEKVKAFHAKHIMEWAKKKRLEYIEVIETNDKFIQEAYSNFTKTQLKKIVSFFNAIIIECTNTVEDSSKTRKPRKKKTKTPEQLVASLNICESFEELSLKSFPKKDIIGANQIWVYNTKTRKLGVYFSSEATGLSVKGSTLINFDETKSVQKTLRKPEKVLPEVIKGGKVYLRTALQNINSVEGKLTGRLNSDTILLRVIK